MFIVFGFLEVPNSYAEEVSICISWCALVSIVFVWVTVMSG